MPHAIVKQPNGRYAIWSSIVDDFLLLDASAEEAVVDELNDPMKQRYPGGRKALRADMCRELENLHETGRAWKWAPTWDEAIEIISELHGDEKANERIRQALGGPESCSS